MSGPILPLGLAAVVCLAGCTVGPNHRRPEATLPAGWAGAAPSEGLVADSASRAELARWWTSLGDPALTALVETALSQNLDLRRARARLRESRARATIAGARRLPEVGASASASHGGTTATPGADGLTTSNSLRGGFDASWEVDLFGGIRRGVEAVEADRESAEANLDAAAVSLVAEVARAYTEITTLWLRLGIARDSLASQTETLQLTEYRANAGLVSDQDVAQARASLEQTRARIPDLESAAAEAEHRLSILLGQAPTRGRVAQATRLPAVPERVAIGIPADTLRQRPDVRAAERRLAAETARVGVAEAARYPSLTLSGSIGLEALMQDAGSSGGLAYSLLGRIAAPIFNGGRLEAAVDAQDAVREQALVDYQKAILDALKEVEDALVSLARSRERSAALEQAALAARSAAEMARQRYGAGLIDFQPVLETERTVLSVADNRASSQADEVLALIRLYKALGGGWSNDAEPGAVAKDDSDGN